MIRGIWDFIQKLSYRTIFGLGFLGCIFALSISIGYFQLYLKLQPCTLCEEQRFILIGMGLLFLIAAIHNPKQQTVKLYAAILLLLACAGFIVSVYQVYWQAQPTESAPICTSGLNPIIQSLPGQSSLKTVFTGTKDCFKQDWEIFSITIPMWSVGFFLGMIAITLWQIFRTVKKNGTIL
jgi:protein dithiol:quinone oxidoreductase